MVFGRKAYKRGIEDGAQPFGEKFEQLHKDIDHSTGVIKEEVNKVHEYVDVVLDDLSKRDKKELYDLVESFDIKDLDMESRQLVIAFLHTLSNTYFDETNQFQKEYLRHITKYLEIINPQIELNLSTISNYEDLTINKALYQLGNEFVFLHNDEFNFETLDEELYDLLNLSKKIKKDIINNIEKLVKNVGKEGLIEKYGFEFEEENEPEENDEFQEELAELDNTIQQSSIRSALFDIQSTILIENIFNSIFTGLEVLLTDEMLDKIKAGNINNNFVKERILGAYNGQDDFDLSFICGLKFKDQTNFLLIFVQGGFYTQMNGEYIYIDYSSLESVKESKKGLMISMNTDYLICADDSDLLGKKKLLLGRSKKTEPYLRPIRKGFESILDSFGRGVSSQDIEAEGIIEKYISQMPKSSSNSYYTREDFYDDKVKKRLNNALNKYAVKVRGDEAVAFIDTSLLSNGKDGLLFAKDGISFDYIFAPTFIRYDEITGMKFGKKEKSLIFSGNFQELKDSETKPEIMNNYFDLHAIKECIEEIQYII